MRNFINGALTASTLVVCSAHAYAAPGDGKYAYDCTKPDTVVEITMNGYSAAIKLTAATVRYKGRTYPNLKAMYDFYGRTASPDFLAAIMFDRGQSPLPNKTRDGGSYFEIWKLGSGYYLLENGNKAIRLSACAN
jgi:hypothetical protein